LLQALDLDAREALCRDMIMAAGRMALEGYNAAGLGTMEMKGPQDFLTETDGRVERYLKERIAEEFPQDGFLGEETGGVPGDNLWVIDPIDGTANFARQIPHFCISIAFVCEGRIEIGAIYNPGLDELHFTRRGQGATRNGTAIHVAGTMDYQRACVELGWSTRLPNSTYLIALDRILTHGANVRRGASGALGLAFVADGRSDAYAELHMHPWDCLAGLLMVKEAGGVIAPFLELDGLSKGGGVLAACPGIAPGMSEATGIALTL
jgi:myo-inositol-1(or 4)-monophosphatase